MPLSNFFRAVVIFFKRFICAYHHWVSLYTLLFASTQTIITAFTTFITLHFNKFFTGIKLTPFKDLFYFTITSSRV